jgi:hypothetical protein
VIWSIWIVNALLQWALLGLILWKRLWREHPAFTLYIAFNSSKSTLLICIRLFLPAHYFAVNSVARLIGLPILVAVLIEVFADVFRPYSTLPQGTIRWFKIVFASLILLTIAAAIFFPGSAPGDIRNTVMVASRSASIIFGGAFGFTALFSSYFGIPWPPRTYGIGVGFLLFMSVDLFASSLIATHGLPSTQILTIVSMLGYSLGLLTWLTYFARPISPPSTPSLEQLQRLQKALDSSARNVESYRETL